MAVFLDLSHKLYLHCDLLDQPSQSLDRGATDDREPDLGQQRPSVCLSLIPFATAYVAATRIAPFPTAVYGALQFACGLAFAGTFAIIDAQRKNDRQFLGVSRSRRTQNAAALAVYAAATVVAARWPLVALALFVLVALAYVAPGLFDEFSRPTRD